MMNYIDFHHLDLLLIFLGTIAVAFSVRPKGQYNKRLMRDIKKMPLGKSLVFPMEVTIIGILFWMRVMGRTKVST